MGSRTFDARPYHELERLANIGFLQEIALSLPKIGGFKHAFRRVGLAQKFHS